MKAYIVRGSYGAFEDETEYTVGAYFNKERANQVMEDRNKDLDERNSKRDSFDRGYDNGAYIEEIEVE